MKNLVLLNKGNIVPESLYYPEAQKDDVNYESVFDVVSDSITFAITIVSESVVEIQQYLKTGEIHILANFPITNPNDKLLSFNHFSEMSQLILIYDNGDIVQVTYDPVSMDADLSMIEIVGSIDVGIKAATWSPDEEILSLLTNENNLLLLSRLFEPITERLLNPNDIKVSKHVSVGWGKAETQFRGKGARALERERSAIKHAGMDLKEDSQLRDPTVQDVQPGTTSDFDDNTCKISWRGDCEYFSVSTKEKVMIESSDETYDRRVIRVFNREGELDSVSEPLNGIEQNLAWKPQGSVIGTTQRCIDADGDAVLNILFYERNGLKRHEFNTRLDPSSEFIQDLQWSSDSVILAFQLFDRVQIWTCKNYHWYLKEEIFVNQSDSLNSVSFIKFHPEKPLRLMIGTLRTGILIIDFAYKVVSGPTLLGSDIGMTLVTDGSLVKSTPFGVANVPPPASLRELETGFNINDMAVSKSNNLFAILHSNGNVTLSKLNINSVKKMKQPKILHTIKSTLISDFQQGEYAKQVAFIEDSIISVLVDGPSYSKVVLFDISNGCDDPLFIDALEFNPKIVVLKPRADFNALAVESITGMVSQIDSNGTVSELESFPQLCYDFELIIIDDIPTFFGISSNGKLFANNTQVATGVTSMKITESHLLFTSVQSQLCFIHLNSASDNYKYEIFQTPDAIKIDERVRQIERGSIIVSAVPSTYSVILQAPRGNLETVCPRIMVLSAVRKYIQQKNYKDAFLTCRVHRIDLDILHDYDPKLFFDNLELFVKQIEKVSHLDLFVSCLHEEDVTVTKYKDTLKESDEISGQLDNLHLTEANVQEDSKRMIFNKDRNTYNKDSKINKICEGILSILLRPEYFDDYLQTTLTAYACQKPANLIEALTLVGGFEDGDKKEQSVIHLCFLLDVNKLYNASLSLYDVKLTLIIAQQSQKDPKEYLPFLQNLHIQPELRKKFLIDDHLKNYTKALDWLHEMGSESQSELDDYVIDNYLYKHALSLYKYDDGRSNDILHMFAQQLRNEKNYAEAGYIFESLKELEESMECYILGKCWKEAISICVLPEFSDKLMDTAKRLVEALTEDHRYSDIGYVQFNFLHDIEAALTSYCKSYEYDTAILLASKEDKRGLIETLIDPLVSEGFGTIAELLADFKGQINSQLRRLRDLRDKKKEDPYAFYGVPNDELDTPDNVSVAASESTARDSFFTRYTGKTGGTAKTGASRKTSKNKKREERKRAKGRKGTIYEEEYLIKSVGRLIERMDLTQNDAIKLIEGLVRRHMKQQAYQIQKNWTELVILLKENVEEIYDMDDRDRERIDDNGELYLIPKIPVPTIKDFPMKQSLDY